MLRGFQCKRLEREHGKRVHHQGDDAGGHRNHAGKRQSALMDDIGTAFLPAYKEFGLSMIGFIRAYGRICRS